MDLLDKCLKVTGAFEGGGFDNVSDNFDGQGVSCGILQWNYGQGSLVSKILRPYMAKYGSIDALGIFPGKVDFTTNLTNSAAVSYADSTMHGRVRVSMFKSKKVLKPEWKKAWKIFLLKEEVVELQKVACTSLYESAVRMRAAWGMESDAALFWFFDILTQNGSLKGVKKPEYDLVEAKLVMNRVDPLCKKEWEKVNLLGAGEEAVILLIASHKRALLSNSRWYKDVLARKGTIALGTGYVHGKKITI